MKKRLLTAVLAALMCATAVTGCKSGEEDSSSQAGTVQTEVPNPNSGINVTSDVDDKDADYTVSGNVTVAVNKNRSTDSAALFDNFASLYPNVSMSIDRFDNAGGTPEYLTSKAQSGSLPDVIFDDYAPLPFYLTQGWMYPLNDFVEGDSDFEFVPDSINESHTYNGKLYAIPDAVHFAGMFLNLDLLDTLNIEHPSLDWTVDDYVELMKKSTTNEYSGTETLFNLDSNLCATTSKDCTVLGYNFDDRSYHLSDVWVPNVEIMYELRAYPGLEAWTLRNVMNGGDTTDYTNKFGDGDTSDLHMAFKMGKTMSDAERGTWDMWLYDFPFNWELWTFPQGNGNKGRFPMHVDYCWMTTGVTAENVDAAFQTLRYLSYSVRGNIHRLSMYDPENEGQYVLNAKYYIPATNNATVAEKFHSQIEDGIINEAVYYMYENMENSVRADVGKLVPGWDNVFNEVITERRNNVTDGQAEASAVAAEIQDRATEALASYWADFDEQLAAAEERFVPVHTKK